MNINEAIARLEKFGYKVYPKEGKFAVWFASQKNNDEDFRYSARDLISLSRSHGTNIGKKTAKGFRAKRDRKKVKNLLHTEKFDGLNQSGFLPDKKSNPWNFD